MTAMAVKSSSCFDNDNQNFGSSNGTQSQQIHRQIRKEMSSIRGVVLILILYRVLSTTAPSRLPTVVPTVVPTVLPTVVPTRIPSCIPSAVPSSFFSVYNKVFLSAGSGTGAPSITTTSGDGGRATSALIYGPRAFFEDSSGLMYIEDTDAGCIRTYSPGGDTIMRLFAGSCGTSGDATSGAATSGKFNDPYGIMGDTLGNIYFPEYSNHKIKKIDASGIVSVIGGTGGTGQTGNSGQATAAAIGYPTDLFVQSTGAVYVTTFYGDQVRKIATDGIITLIARVLAADAYAGNGGPATSAKLYSPEKIRLDTTGLLYISDTCKCSISLYRIH